MKVFAISDLHLSVNNPKPMDIFGCVWEGYIDKIFDDWKKKVSCEDIVLLAGDFSWAMKLEDAKADFDLLKDLPGKKAIIGGVQSLKCGHVYRKIFMPYKMMPSSLVML